MFMGEWRHSDGGDWFAWDCETKFGPLAGPPIILRVTLAWQGPAWVGEAHRPGEYYLLILPVDPDTGQTHGWPTAEDARAALEAVLRNEHDPASIWTSTDGRVPADWTAGPSARGGPWSGPWRVMRRFLPRRRGSPARA